MNKRNYEKKIALFIAISQVLSFIALLVYHFHQLDYVKLVLLPIFSICLIIGILKRNKTLISAYIAYPVINFIGNILYCIIAIFGGTVYGISLYISQLMNGLGSIAFTVALILLILRLFDLKGEPNSKGIEPNHKELTFDTNLLIDYKNLLDSGAITQEEFDAKKKEVLGL